MVEVRISVVVFVKLQTLRIKCGLLFGIYCVDFVCILNVACSVQYEDIAWQHRNIRSREMSVILKLSSPS